jgi:hypothetical protein
LSAPPLKNPQEVQKVTKLTTFNKINNKAFLNPEVRTFSGSSSDLLVKADRSGIYSSRDRGYGNTNCQLLNI